MGKFKKKPTGYEIVKPETRYLWFYIKHIPVAVKNSYYTLWWFTEVPLRSHDIFYNALFFLLDNSDFFMGFIYARECIHIGDAKILYFIANI